MEILSTGRNMETIPNSDSAWIQAFSPISLGKKKKEIPKNFQGNWEHMVPPSCSVERNVKKIRETLSKRQTWHCVAGKVALVPCLPPSLHQDDPSDLGLYGQSCDCDLDTRFTQFLFSK